jgi:HK97 gp10 family phage protein
MAYGETRVTYSGIMASGADLLKAVEAVLDKAAHDVEAGWKEEIISKRVIDTGAYLNSVKVQSKQKRFERVISDGVEYGIYQEFGTSHFPARPCAQPAMERVRRSFLKALGQICTVTRGGLGRE